MGDFARKADGRVVFTAEFKRKTVERIRSGETTLATIARELDIQPAIIRRWVKLDERGSTTAVQAGEDVVPISRLRELEKQVKDLQRLVGKQAMTIEILEAAREVVKKVHTCSKGPSGDRASDDGGVPGAARGALDGLSAAAASRRRLLPAQHRPGSAARHHVGGEGTGELWCATGTCPCQSKPSCPRCNPL